MNRCLRRLAEMLPLGAQQSLKRRLCVLRIRTGHFVSEEPEFQLLEKCLHQGDWALDVGATSGTMQPGCPTW